MGRSICPYRSDTRILGAFSFWFPVMILIIKRENATTNNQKLKEPYDYLEVLILA